MTLPGLTTELTPRRLKRLLKDYIKTLKAEPGNLVVRLKVAFVLKELGRVDEALDVYQDVARAFAADGRLVQAIAVCKGILEIDPEHQATQEMLAELVQRQRPARRMPALRMQQVDGRWIAIPVAEEALYSDVLPMPQTSQTSQVTTRPGSDPDETPPPGLLDAAPWEEDSAPLDVHTEVTHKPGDSRRGQPMLVATDPFEAPPELEPDLADLPGPPGGSVLDFPDEAKAFARGGLLLDLPPAPTHLDLEAISDREEVTAAASPSKLRREVEREASDLELEAVNENTQPRLPSEIALEAEPPPQVPTVRDRPPRRASSGSTRAVETDAPGTDLFEPDEEVMLGQLSELPAPPMPAQQAALDTIPLFSDLPRDAFVALLGKMGLRREPPERVIVREGETGDSFFVVSSGVLRVLKRRPDGQETEVAKLGPGSFFGEFALLGDQRRHATVMTASDVELFEISRKVVDEILAIHPDVMTTLRRFYRERMLATLLSTAPLFQPLSPEEKGQLASRLVARRFADGDTVVREGGRTEGLYLILSGGVVVTIGEVEVGRLGEGSYFGEMSLLRGGNASATVRAGGATEVVQLPARDFYHVMAAHPVVWQEIRREAARREAANAALLTGRTALP